MAIPTNHFGRLIAIAALWAAASGPGFGASWSEINSGLPRAVAGISALTIDPATPSTVYARTSGGKIFKSKDGGGSWNAISSHAISSVTGVNSLVIDPENTSTIYAATDRGVVKSTDGGATWIGASNGLEGSGIASLFIDPITPSTLYALSGGLFKSTDAGGNWYKIASFTREFSLRTLVIDPRNSSTIYACDYSSGIFQSTDGGASWNSLNAGLPLRGDPLSRSYNWSIQAVNLAIDPVTPSTLYLGYIEFIAGGRQNPQLLKSTDAGISWNALDSGLPFAWVGAFAIDPLTPSTIYARYGNLADDGRGIVKSTNGGESWSVIDTGLAPDTHFRWIAIDPASPSTLYAGHVDDTGRGGMIKSVNGGASWNVADAGLDSINVGVLTIDPVNASTIYAVPGIDGVFKSIDRGTNWTKLAAIQIPAPPQDFFKSSVGATPAIIRSLVIDFTHPNILYASTIRANGECLYTDNLLFKSTNGGVTWSNIGQPSTGCGLYSAQWMAMDPSDPNILYVGGEDDDGDPAAWLSKSANGGANWGKQVYLAGASLNALVIDRANPTTFYAGTSSGYAGTSSGVFKTSDAGVTWSNAGLNDSVNVLAMDPGDSSVLYAATQDSHPSPNGFAGLFKSTDGGASWSPINNGLDSLIETHSAITAVAIDPANPACSTRRLPVTEFSEASMAAPTGAHSTTVWPTWMSEP